MHERPDSRARECLDSWGTLHDTGLVDLFPAKPGLSAEQARTVVEAARQMAFADGEVHPRERAALEGLAATLGVTPNGEETPMVAPARLEGWETDAAEYLLYVVTLVSYVDGSQAERERDLLRSWARAMGVAPETVDRIDRLTRRRVLAASVLLELPALVTNSPTIRGLVEQLGLDDSDLAAVVSDITASAGASSERR